MRGYTHFAANPSAVSRREPARASEAAFTKREPFVMRLQCSLGNKKGAATLREAP